MRRPRRYIPSELVCVLLQFVGSYRDPAFKIIPYEDYFLYISIFDHGLEIFPFDFLGIGPALVEEHPYYSEDQQDIDPRHVECNPFRLPSSVSAVFEIRFVAHLAIVIHR